MGIKYKNLKINNDIIQDAKNIVNGAYYPLTGFLREKDFRSVLDNMRLVNGLVWSIPIVIDIDKENKKKLENENHVVLVDENNNEVAILENIEIYPYDNKEFVKKVFGTTDNNHPGVAEIMDMDEYLDRKSTRLNSSHTDIARMPSSA